MARSVAENDYFIIDNSFASAHVTMRTARQTYIWFRCIATRWKSISHEFIFVSESMSPENRLVVITVVVVVVVVIAAAVAAAVCFVVLMELSALDSQFD